MLVKEICHGSCGCYAVVYDENTESVGHWYGTRAECEALDPKAVTLHPLTDEADNPDSFDLACERRHD